MNHNGNNIEARLWEAADELRANSKLKSSEYSVLGLVFLRYTDYKFQAAAKELLSQKLQRAIVLVRKRLAPAVKEGKSANLPEEIS